VFVQKVALMTFFKMAIEIDSGRSSLLFYNKQKLKSAMLLTLAGRKVGNVNWKNVLFSVDRRIKCEQHGFRLQLS